MPSSKLDYENYGFHFVYALSLFLKSFALEQSSYHIMIQFYEEAHVARDWGLPKASWVGLERDLPQPSDENTAPADSFLHNFS